MKRIHNNFIISNIKLINTHFVHVNKHIINMSSSMRCAREIINGSNVICFMQKISCDLEQNEFTKKNELWPSARNVEFNFRNTNSSFILFTSLTNKRMNSNQSLTYRAIRTITSLFHFSFPPSLHCDANQEQR